MSFEIVGIAMEVHRELGSGFLEKVYENALMHLLKEKGIEAIHYLKATEKKLAIIINFKSESLQYERIVL